MALMKMQHPGLTEQYFISSFIAGLKEGIKHYLVLHNPQTLSDTYWQAKELEKGILVKKTLMHSNHAYPKLITPFTTILNRTKSNLAQPKPIPPNQPNQPLPIKPRQPRKCWGCQEPWTPEHKFNCKFRRVVNAMAMSPEDWLVVEQVMEDENHVLLQAETSEHDQQPP
jgi:hypothetical protein